MDYEYKKTDDVIYEAIFNDDWGHVSNTFKNQPKLRTMPINQWLETPLMIAVGTNRSHRFVKNLLSSFSMEGDLITSTIAAENDEGDTALHYAAKIGNIIDAKRLLNYSSKPAAEILQHTNKGGCTPLYYAASMGSKNELLKYFYSLGIFSSPNVGSGVSNGIRHLLRNAIDAGFLDIALKLVESQPNINSRELQRSLQLLAAKPNLFPSGSKLGFWHRCIYDLLPVYASKVSSEEKKARQQIAHDEEAICVPKKICNNAYCKFTCYCKCISTTAIFIRRIFQYLASPLINIHDLKRTHKQTKDLVKRICIILKQKHNQDGRHAVNALDALDAMLGSTIDAAVRFGNYEVIKECILVFPSICTDQAGVKKMFLQAIRYRQEQVYKLVYQMSSSRVLVLTDVDEHLENILHIAAKLASSNVLNTVTGAALQMQRELRWYQEIESLVGPTLQEINDEMKTPRKVFDDEHKELLKEGKEWMKDTASSSTVVAALIVTVAFAAIFTLPGGDANKGKIAFKLFIISDAIALFSSATSALLFLGILTSRYAQKDFLDVLPRILLGGLFSLFLSLAATMITFSATLALVLQREMPWIAAPLVVITSIPIGMFVLIQRPLLVELFNCTYGPSIFPK